MIDSVTFVMVLDKSQKRFLPKVVGSPRPLPGLRPLTPLRDFRPSFCSGKLILTGSRLTYTNKTELNNKGNKCMHYSINLKN